MILTGAVDSSVVAVVVVVLSLHHLGLTCQSLSPGQNAVTCEVTLADVKEHSDNYKVQAKENQTQKDYSYASCIGFKRYACTKLLFYLHVKDLRNFIQDKYDINLNNLKVVEF